MSATTAHQDLAALEREIHAIATDPAASGWLKEAVATMLKRDPVDAANDAEVLAELMAARARLATTRLAG